MKHVYAVTCNEYPDSLTNSDFYSTRKKARRALKVIAKELSSKSSNEVHDNAKDLFSFMIPSSDDLIIYSIIKITVE